MALQLLMAVTITLYFPTLVPYTGYAPLPTQVASSLPSDDYQALPGDDVVFPEAKANILSRKPLVDLLSGIGEFEP